jgi:GNAT superfamily N-acetyltransferase
MLQILEHIEDNEWSTFETLKAHPAGVVEERAKYKLLFTGAKSPLLNGIFKIRLNAKELEAAIPMWIEYFAKTKAPFYVHTFAGLNDPSLEQRLSVMGFKPAPTNVAICVDSNVKVPEFRSLPDSSSVRVLRVATDALANDFCRVMSVAFQLGSEMSRFMTEWYIAYGYNELNEFQSVIAYVGDKAVGIASYSLAAGICGIYNVAVLEEQRNHGIGKFMTLAIGKAALEKGVKLFGGTGSEDGMRVYTQFPHQRVGTATRWSYVFE